MRTERGFTRLVSFSDGVVAIAITLLVLPLVESATDSSGDVVAFLNTNGFQLFVFVLSFAVIGRFWFVHHQLYENLAGYSTGLVWANLLWLLTIVFLPFPTELLITGDSDDRLRNGLYVGTMLLTSCAALLQQWIAIRSPELQAPEARGTLRLGPYVLTTAVMAIALTISVAFPQVGLLSLLLLAVMGPIGRVLLRRQAST